MAFVNGMIMNDELEMMGKEVVVVHFKVIPQHIPGGPEESMKTVRMANLGQHSKPGPLTYKAGLLTTILCYLLHIIY
jgi:hypothetical protein